MEMTNELVPYIVKRFKVLSLQDNKNQCDVAYVNKIEDTELENLEKFLNKKVKFKKKIPEAEFWKIASDLYPEISFENIRQNEKLPDAEVMEDVEKPKTVQPKKEKIVREVDISKIPMNVLIQELRRRHMSLDAEAIIEINPNLTASFEFNKIPWPAGKYRTKLQIIEEIFQDKKAEK